MLKRGFEHWGYWAVGSAVGGMIAVAGHWWPWVAAVLTFALIGYGAFDQWLAMRRFKRELDATAEEFRVRLEAAVGPAEVRAKETIAYMEHQAEKFRETFGIENLPGLPPRPKVH